MIEFIFLASASLVYSALIEMAKIIAVGKYGILLSSDDAFDHLLYLRTDSVSKCNKFPLP